MNLTVQAAYNLSSLLAVCSLSSIVGSQVGRRGLSQLERVAASGGARSEGAARMLEAVGSDSSGMRRLRDRGQRGGSLDGRAGRGLGEEVRGRLVQESVRDLLVGLELVDAPLEALTTLDHVDHVLSLVVLILLGDVVLKLGVASSNFNEKRVIAFVLLNCEPICANQVEVVLDMLNGVLDVKLLNVEFDLLVDQIALSWLEFNWSVLEKLFALFVDLGLRNSKLANVHLG